MYVINKGEKRALATGTIIGIGHGALGAGLGTFGKAVAHGVAQGALGSLRGGTFKAGFAGGFLSHAVPVQGGKISGLVQKTVIGGTAAEISGGKFANGAKSAAFVYLFNEAGSRLRIVFDGPSDQGRLPEEAGEAGYRLHDGDPDQVRKELEFYSKTPKGREVMSQDGVIFIRPEGGRGPETDIGGIVINYNGGRQNAIAHEMGHTIYGGAYCDYAGQAAGCGTEFPIGNVQTHEHPFQDFIGQPRRQWYVETIPGPNYGNRYWVGD